MHRCQLTPGPALVPPATPGTAHQGAPQFSPAVNYPAPQREDLLQVQDFSSLGGQLKSETGMLKKGQKQRNERRAQGSPRLGDTGQQSPAIATAKATPYNLKAEEAGV